MIQKQNKTKKPQKHKNTKKKKKQQFCAILEKLAYYLQICYQLCILK